MGIQTSVREGGSFRLKSVRRRNPGRVVQFGTRHTGVEHAQTLSRNFDEIWFGSSVSGPAEPGLGSRQAKSVGWPTWPPTENMGPVTCCYSMGTKSNFESRRTTGHGRSFAAAVGFVAGKIYSFFRRQTVRRFRSFEAAIDFGLEKSSSIFRSRTPGRLRNLSGRSDFVAGPTLGFA